MLARHENVNRRVKWFDSLSGTLHHDVLKHRVFFHALASTAQIAIEAGDELPSLAKQSHDQCFVFHDFFIQIN